MPQARKALKRDRQRATGQRTNPRGNSKAQKRRNNWKAKMRKKAEGGFFGWMKLGCRVQ